MSFLSFAWNWLKAPAQWHGSGDIPIRLLQHLGYSGLSLLVAALIALPAGIWIGHTGRGGVVVVNIANAWRAIPTLGLLVLMVVLIGFSVLAWLVPLVVLAIPPILVNAYAGVAGVDPGLRDAARGMGMTGWQSLRKVELPVALPLITWACAPGPSSSWPPPPSRPRSAWAASAGTSSTACPRATMPRWRAAPCWSSRSP